MWSRDVLINFHLQFFQSSYKQILNNLIKKIYRQNQGNRSNKKKQEQKEGWAIGKKMHEFRSNNTASSSAQVAIAVTDLFFLTFNLQTCRTNLIWSIFKYLICCRYSVHYLWGTYRN